MKTKDITKSLKVPHPRAFSKPLTDFKGLTQHKYIYPPVLKCVNHYHNVANKGFNTFNTVPLEPLKNTPKLGLSNAQKDLHRQYTGTNKAG